LLYAITQILTDSCTYKHVLSVAAFFCQPVFYAVERERTERPRTGSSG